MALLNWTELGEYSYRQISLYDMEWEDELDLEHFYVVAAKFGGPIARVMKPKSLIMGIVHDNQLFRKYLTIHNSSGKLTGRVPWDFNKEFVGMGWTTDEILVVVFKTGELDLYNILGEKVAYPPPVFGYPPPENKEIVDCEVFENMLIILTKENYFYYIRHLPNTSNFRPELIAKDDRNSQRPLCFKTIPSNCSSSGDLEILCGHPEGGLAIVSESEKNRIKRLLKIPFTNEDISRVTNISLSADGTYLALYSEGGTVVVLHSNLSKFLGRSDTGKHDQPLQLVWCGIDAVCIVYKEFVGILGPESRTASIEYNHIKDGVYCISEIDGLRVFTTEKCEFWEKVDDSLQSIYSIGSFSPAALLLVAYENYIENSASSGDSIRSLQNEGTLEEAVESCIKGAQFEFDLESQEKLLKSAGFGKTFLPPGGFDSNKFVTTIKHLRVLNNIRKYEVGRPLTYAQLLNQRQNGELLIKRLMESHHHYLAIKIASYWKLRQDHIYVHWACAKLIDQSYTDQEMCDIICSKLQDCKQVNYTDIARKALDCGRRELAISLLENERNVSRKVPLLLYMNAYQLALDRAIDSLDPDLIYLVIMRIHEEDRLAKQDPDYIPQQRSGIESILNKQVARELLLTFAKQSDESLLKQAFQYLKRPNDAAQFALQKGYKYNDIKRRVELISAAKELFKMYDKDPLCLVMAKEQLDLIGRQKQLIKRTGDRSIIDCSLCGTITKLIKQDQEREAEKLARQFYVPEKKMWYIKLKVKADQGDWDAVEELSRVKKVPPIGWKPFANIAVQCNQKQLAEHFISRVNDPDYQLLMFNHIESYMKAAEVALKMKNEDALDEIFRRTDDQDVRDFIENGVRR